MSEEYGGVNIEIVHEILDSVGIIIDRSRRAVNHREIHHLSGHDPIAVFLVIQMLVKISNEMPQNIHDANSAVVLFQPA